MPQKTPTAEDDFLQSFLLAQQTQETTIHQGILPPPEMLKEYEKLIPNASERFLTIVEKEQGHRHSTEEFLIQSAVKDAKASRSAQIRGDCMAVFIFLTCTLIGVWMLDTGKSEKIAGTLIGGPLLVALASFLYSRNKGKRKQKNGQIESIDK